MASIALRSSGSPLNQPTSRVALDAVALTVVDYSATLELPDSLVDVYVHGLLKNTGSVDASLIISEAVLKDDHTQVCAKAQTAITITAGQTISIKSAAPVNGGTHVLVSIAHGANIGPISGVLRVA